MAEKNQILLKNAINYIETTHSNTDNLIIKVTKAYLEDEKSLITKSYYSKKKKKQIQDFYKESFIAINRLSGLKYSTIMAELTQYNPGDVQDLFRRGSIHEIFTYEV